MIQAFDKNVFVSGSASGTLYVWDKETALSVAKQVNFFYNPQGSHIGGIQTLFFESMTSKLFSAGDDGYIREWNFVKKELAQTQEIFVNTSTFPKQIIALDFYMDTLLAGTGGAEIYEINYQNKKQAFILQASFDGELWGGCASPSSNHFVIAGDDKFIRKYDIQKNKMDRSLVVKHKVRAVDWSKDGKYIVAADTAGVLYLIDAQQFTLLHEYPTVYTKLKKPNKGEYWCEDVKFSPDGRYVVLGVH